MSVKIGEIAVETTIHAMAIEKTEKIGIIEIESKRIAIEIATTMMPINVKTETIEIEITIVAKIDENVEMTIVIKEMITHNFRTLGWLG